MKYFIDFTTVLKLMALDQEYIIHIFAGIPQAAPIRAESNTVKIYVYIHLASHGHATSADFE